MILQRYWLSSSAVSYITRLTQDECVPTLKETWFPQALEIMENLENHEKKFHAWKNHEIGKNPEKSRRNHGIL